MPINPFLVYNKSLVVSKSVFGTSLHNNNTSHASISEVIYSPGGPGSYCYTRALPIFCSFQQFYSVLFATLITQQFSIFCCLRTCSNVVTISSRHFRRFSIIFRMAGPSLVHCSFLVVSIFHTSSIPIPLGSISFCALHVDLQSTVRFVLFFNLLFRSVAILVVSCHRIRCPLRFI